MQKIGRNSPCPCGSGQKFKKCCGHPVTGREARGRHQARAAADLRRMMADHQSREAIRQHQQGLGKPIISMELGGRRVVAVGSTIYHSPTWKVMPDFLSHMLKQLIGTDWGNAELKKSPDQQHTLIQWYRLYAAWQASGPDLPEGAIRSMPATGAVWCYLGLAYNLYLIKHNVELQARMLQRLRDPRNFQGVYYELIVANLLIRAGFELALEDEQDQANKHCEFSAIAPPGKKYWVEAKMRSVSGHFGKTAVDGSTGKDPTEKVTEHLRQALRKPAADDRLVFIDINAPTAGEHPPAWVDRTIKRLDESAKGRTAGQVAYVFVTNMSHHHHLGDTTGRAAVLPYGYGIADFPPSGQFTFSQLYRLREKHRDAFSIVENVRTYPAIPVSFDGSLPSDLEAPDSRPTIGEKYIFEEGGEDYLAEVTAATMSDTGEMYLGVLKEDGIALVLQRKATAQQLADFKQHGDAFFGGPRRTKLTSDDPYEFFIWLLENFKRLPREKMLEQIKEAADYEVLAALTTEDLAVELAERQANTVIEMNQRSAAAKKEKQK